MSRLTDAMCAIRVRLSPDGLRPHAAERREHEGTTMQTMAQTATLVARKDRP